MQRRFVPAFALVLALAAPAFALDPFDFLTAREKAMGGRHVALADDFSVLLSNPAGLADLPKKLSAANLGIQAIGPVFDIANLVTGSVTQESIVDFLKANDYRLYAGMEITGPLAFGYTGGGLGFGLFNKSKFTVNVANISNITIQAKEDLLLTGAYARSFDLGKDNELSAGMAAKGFVRGEISPTMGIIEAMKIINSPMSLLSDDFTLYTGIGMDAGLRWSWKGRVAAGLACRDIYSPVIVTKYSSASSFVSDPASAKVGSSSYETLKRSLDFGLSWSPRLGRLGEVIDSVVLALDYKDILDLASVLPRNAILNLSFGAEVRMLQILALRLGLSETLLSAGASLDLGAFSVSLATYGAELSREPGRRPYYNLLIDFDFKY
jgi:hypothetical protein